MGDKSIKKETKKMKKSNIKSSVSSAPREVVTQPELIKKEKKHR